MVFDAPGRLSTITGLPSESESLSPSKRATMSLGPPVVTGTTKRMLLVGYADWLCAASGATAIDRKSTRLNSSHANISYAVFCLKKKKKNRQRSTVQHSNHSQLRDVSLT